MPPAPSNARIFVLANASKPHIAEPFGRLTAWLKNRGQLAGAECHTSPEGVNESEPDYLIAVGGDGTILHAAQAMGTRQVPIIGVNMGKLGYLADFVEQEVYQSLDQLLGNDALISQRMMFDVRVLSPGGETWSGMALNDCVVRVGDPFRTITLEVSIDGQPMCILAGDGVILATPTGSTAHNMSCGGPIVEPSVHAIIMTPRCPHSFTHRPVVVSDSCAVSVRILPQSSGASAVLDGQRVQPVGPEWRIVVSKSHHFARLVRNPQRRSLDTLITKLKWGVDVT